MEHLAEFTIATVRGGAEYARVILRGDLDHHSGLRLRTELSAVLDTGVRYLTVDFAGVRGCDEGVLDTLDWAARRAAAQRGWLALTGVNHHLRFAPEGHWPRDR
ncbi:MAG TPA: STAS domain-containing protein [Pseudonocardiaceae bacterium]|nr:STAS domain-containing protein [Pseudonocardiaceae bacterium]